MSIAGIAALVLIINTDFDSVFEGLPRFLLTISSAVGMRGSMWLIIREAGASTWLMMHEAKNEDSMTSENRNYYI